MKKKQLLAVALALGTALMTLADEPFRRHRYDSFMATPPMEEATVFLGNSITNIHNWNEAFNSDEHVINRGNSGGFAYEWIEQIEAITDFKPAKLFIGIGTNDISSGQSVEAVVENISLIVDRVKIASPRTKIHIQTVLPRSHNGDYCMPRITEVNNRLKAMYAGSDVTVIDLTEPLTGVRTQSGSGVNSYAPDGLHPSGKAYRVWANHIKNYVNGEVGYFDGEYNSIITSVANPDRIGQFSLLPVKSTDVLFLGDEMVENGEWNELLRNFNVKKRSNGYGHGGIGLAAAKNYMTVSLTTNAEKQKAPAKVLIYCGVAELTNTAIDAAAYKTAYADLVQHIHTLAPNTEVVAVSILSTNGLGDKATAFNAALQELAAADAKLTYVDIESHMAADCYQGNYVNGLGYVTIANLLAPVIGDCNPVTEEEYEAYYNDRLSRKELGMLYNKVFKALNKTNVGQAGGYTAEGVAALQTLKGEIAAQLAKGGSALEVTDDFATRVNAAMSMMALPGAFDGRYYRLTSLRENRALSVANGAIAGQPVDATTTRGGDIWRFDLRPDGTYDITTYNGYYLTPGASATTVSKTKPACGWSLSHSDYAPGTYVIYASNAGTNYQINQAGGSTFVHNWYGSTFPNRNDQGCSYVISEYDGAMEPEQVVTDRWVKMKYVNGSYQSALTGTTNNTVITLSPGVDRSNGIYEIKFVGTKSVPCEDYIFMSINADGTRSFRFPSGHYFDVAGIAIRGDEQMSTTDTRLKKNLNVTFDSNNYMSIQYVTPFNNGNNVILGGKAGTNVGKYEVTDADVSPYDIWTVTIKGVNSTSPAGVRAIRNDLTVTYNNAANKGHRTVYNNGTFFVDKGTVINASDLTFGNGTGQALTTPQVTISNSGKTIIVDWTAGMPEGWYTMDVHSYSGSRSDIAHWTNTATSNNTDQIYAAEEELQQVLGGGVNYYHVNIGAAQTDRPAKHLIYLVKNSATSYSAQTISGHYFKDNGCADRAVNFVTFTPHATEANVYNTVWCVWGNYNATNNSGGSSNGSNSIGATTAMIGKFSGNTTYYNFLPASTEGYNVYKVTILGAPNAARISNDTRVTLNHPENKGLNRVYNGGRFFVTAGHKITAEHLSAPVVNDITPRISVTPGSILVDYTTEVTNVTSVTLDRTAATIAAGSSTKLNATVVASEGTVPTLLWTTSNPAVATVNISGLVKAVGKGTATITATCGDKKATATITVSQPATGVNISQSLVDIELPTTGEVQPVQLTATVLPANSDQTEVSWSSSDPEVASVLNGSIQAYKTGSTMITATCGNASSHCMVYVTATTGIDGVITEGFAGTIYDLQGRRVMRPQHGIYIRNGVKIKL